MLTDHSLTARAHGVPRRARHIRPTSSPREDSPDRRLLAAVLSDPARVTASAVGRLDEEIRRLWTETDPARVVRIATAALAVGRGSSCRTPLWTVVHDGRAGGEVPSRIRALALLCADDFAPRRAA